MAEVRFEGVTLYHESSGAGPAVTFVHPGLWDSRTWDPQMASFEAAGYRVARYDVRGYGRSSRPTGEPYSHVRDLIAVLGDQGIERTALIGCSMGGAIVLDVALEHPDRVWALVAVASGLGGLDDSTPEEDAFWADRDPAIEAAVEAGDLERAQELRLRVWAPLGTDDPAGRAIRRIAFDNLHEITMDESAAEDLDPPALARLAEIAAPTLVVDAGLDPPDIRRSCRVIADGVPGARLITLDDADHVVNLRRPEAFDRIVLDFLAGVRPAG
jgi:3-oxoadipate enol-lactonase